MYETCGNVTPLVLLPDQVVEIGQRIKYLWERENRHTQQDRIWLVSLENKARSAERSWVHPDAEQEDFCGMGKMFPAQLQSVPQCRDTHCGKPGLQRWGLDRQRTTGCVYVQQPQ